MPQKDRFADKKTVQRIGLLTVFFNLLICKPFPCQSIADPLDPAIFWGIFVGAEASRMKGMPQGHPGWVYGQ